jgi:hypothetical protein
MYLYAVGMPLVSKRWHHDFITYIVAADLKAGAAVVAVLLLENEILKPVRHIPGAWP